MTRSLVDIRNALKLEEFGGGPLGTLYFAPSEPRPLMLFRHFDSELPEAMVDAYVSLVHAVHDWVERRPAVARLVEVEVPTEVGRDFVARKHHVYYTSLDSYTWEEPNAPEPPPELEEMRAVLRAEMGKSEDQRQRLVEAVLARSLLEPSSKTYETDMHGSAGFVIVEPRMTPEQVKSWYELTHRA